MRVCGVRMCGEDVSEVVMVIEAGWCACMNV